MPLAASNAPIIRQCCCSVSPEAHAFAIVIGTIGAVGLLLAVVHGIEAAFWAAACLWLGALDSPEDAILYSFDSMTTRGVLLFGISTAFLFAVMQYGLTRLFGSAKARSVAGLR